MLPGARPVVSQPLKGFPDRLLLYQALDEFKFTTNFGVSKRLTLTPRIANAVGHYEKRVGPTFEQWIGARIFKRWWEYGFSLASELIGMVHRLPWGDCAYPPMSLPQPICNLPCS